MDKYAFYCRYLLLKASSKHVIFFPLDNYMVCCVGLSHKIQIKNLEGKENVSLEIKKLNMRPHLYILWWLLKTKQEKNQKNAQV